MQEHAYLQILLQTQLHSHELGRAIFVRIVLHLCIGEEILIIETIVILLFTKIASRIAMNTRADIDIAGLIFSMNRFDRFAPCSAFRDDSCQRCVGERDNGAGDDAKADVWGSRNSRVLMINSKQ